MKIDKLIKMGRVKPIYVTKQNDEKFLIGYERSKDSKKSYQKYWLKKPQKVGEIK